MTSIPGELDPNDKDSVRRHFQEQMKRTQRERALRDELQYSKVVEIQSKNLG